MIIETNPVVIEVLPGNAVIVGQEGVQGPPGPQGPSSAYFVMEFSQANLSVANLLPVVHGLDREPVLITIRNQDGIEIEPDGIEFNTINTLTINLVSFVPISGTYKLLVGG